MCGSGGKTQTATTSQTSGPAQYIQDAYQSLVGQAQGVANTAYNPATEKQVAGLTGLQNQGIAGAQSNQGAYQPYLQNAASSAAAGVAPVSTQSIMANYNPFVQAQVDALQANLGLQNAQTLQASNSNAAKLGALTGDRSQVAAQMAMNDNNRNAATAMAGLQSNAFGQAANLAQGNQSAALQGANVYSNLGTMAQNAGYTDANALLGVGGLQQGQQQSVYDANSANAAAQSAYPYQNLDWLSGILGNAGQGSGTTSTGSTTTPGPNMWSQILGAGLAGASFLKNGGRVNSYAGGGGVIPYGGAPSYVPEVEMTAGRGPGVGPSLAQASGPQSNGMADVLSSFKQAKGAFTGLGNLGQQMRTTTDPNSGWSTTVNPSGVSGWGNYLSSMFGKSHGGGVRGYEGGGFIDDPWGLDEETTPDMYADPEVMGGMGFAESPQPSGGVFPPPGPMVPPASAAAQTAPQQPSQSGGLFGLLPVSDNARNALLTTGLGMMASRSPFIGSAIGEGGLAGAQVYQEGKRNDANTALKKESIAVQAQRLAQAAQTAAENLKLRTRQTDAVEGRNAAAAAVPRIMGKDSLGREIYGVFDPQTGSYKPIEAGAPSAEAAAFDQNLTGDDYLATLPGAEATIIQKMVNGEMAPPTSFAASKPYWQGMLLKAAQYDPGFDLTTWGARNAGHKDFYGGGKSSEMVRSANQTIGHIGDLVDSMKTLDNTQYPAANYAKNEFNKAMGKPGLDPFKTNAHAVAGELSKVFKGANISDNEIREWEGALSANMSPPQQKAMVVKLSHLLNSALDALEQKRSQSIGDRQSKKKGPLLDKHAQDTLRKIKAWAGDTDATPGMTEETEVVAAPTAPAAPPVGAVVGGYRFKGGNPADRANWEKQ